MSHPHLRAAVLGAVVAAGLGLALPQAMAAPTPAPFSTATPHATATPGATPDAAKRGHVFTATTPTSPTGSVTVTLRGAVPGEKIFVKLRPISGAPDVDPEVLDHLIGNVVADSQGRASVTVTPPRGGWGPGSVWSYRVSANGGELGGGQVTVPASAGKGPKDGRGRLAKTGV